MSDAKTEPKGEKVPENQGSPYDAAAEKIRDAAKWLLAAFAAVGATLAAGLQLASIGELDGSRPLRFGVAIVGVLIAVGAIVFAIWAAGEILTRRLVTLSDIIRDSDLAEERQALNANPDYTMPYGSLTELKADWEKLRKRERELREAYDSATLRVQSLDPSPQLAQDPKWTVDAANALKDLRNAEAHWSITATAAQSVDRVRREVLSATSFMRVARAYKTQRRAMACAAAIAAVGIILFAWGANPPDSTATTPGEVLPITPSPVFVELQSPSSAVVDQLGSECDVDKRIPAVAMTVSGQTYQVATQETDTCNAAWISVTVPDEGTVSPRQVDE